MKLKTRLTIAFTAIVLGTMCFVTASLLGLGMSRLKQMEKRYGEKLTISNLFNVVQTMSASTDEIWQEMNEVSQENPDAFLNFSYLQEENSALSDHLSYLLLVKEEEIYYIGSEQDSWEDDLDQLQAYGTVSSGLSYYIEGSKQAMIRQIDILFTDSTQGCAYIVTSLTGVLPPFRSLILQMILLILLVLIVIALVMTLWIYSGIKRPLDHLSESVKKITQGAYDFTIEPQGDQEIRNLCVDLEKMRNHLAETEEQKEKYDAQSRELITNISHDLKTPITTVKGYVEGIMDGVADTPEKMDHYIKTIYTKANDMDRLINELTFYTKIDTNRIPYHFARLNVKEFFDDCAEETDIEMQEKGIRFTYMNKIKNGVRIIADPEQLRRVMDNIFSNSVKYMDKREKLINLRVLDVGDFVQVEVEDNGRGIESKDLTRIFDRFYRTDSSRNSMQGGSGIGLSIVKKIVEDHSGRIWATSRPERGTTIHFVLRKYQGNCSESSQPFA